MINIKMISKITLVFVRLFVICVCVVILVWISGFFTTLHPDAYRDAIRSAVFIYLFYVVVTWGYSLLRSEKMSKKQISVTRKGDRTNSNQLLPLKKIGKRLRLKDESVIEAVGGAFTLITLVNSIMMLTGYDTPKIGSFAYLHIIVRFLIISTVVSVWMWHDTVSLGKKWISFLTSDIDSKKEILLTNFRSFYTSGHRRLFSSISKIFTLTTIIFCVIVILLSSIINPEGGPFFYQLLLAMLGLITILMITVRWYRIHYRKVHRT